MQTRIQGTTMPVLEVQLDPNESVFSESGELSWMSQSIQMTTHTQMGGGGGLMGVFKRVAGGGSLFMTEYRAFQYAGEVAFATKVPGHIIPIQLGQGVDIWCTVTAFSAPRRRLRSAWDFSSRSGPASLAVRDLCCSASAAWARHGLKSLAS